MPFRFYSEDATNKSVKNATTLETLVSALSTYTLFSKLFKLGQLTKARVLYIANN